MPNIFTATLDRLLGRDKATSTAFSPSLGPSVGWATAWGRPRPRQVQQMPQAFEKNGWVFAAVGAIAENASCIPVRVMREGRGRDAEPTELTGPFVDLIDRPNPYMTGEELRELVVIWKRLAGNAYLEVVRNGAGVPMELYVLPADRVTIVPHPETFVAEYIVQVAGGMYRLPAGDMIHFKEPNPFDPWYGMSRLTPIGFTLEADVQADAFNEAFFRNNAAPGGVLSFDKDTLSAADEKRIKENWNAAHQGPDKAFRTAVVWGGAKWMQIVQSHKDIGFGELSDRARDKILSVLRVPTSIVHRGADESFATAMQRERSFWTNTIIPENKRTAAVLTHQLLPMFGARLGGDPRRGQVWVEFDYSGVEALAAVLKEQADTYVPLVRTGIMTINEARERLGLSGDVEWGEEWHPPTGQDPILDSPAAAQRAAPPARRKAAEDPADDTKRITWKRMDRRVEAASRLTLRAVRGYFAKQEQRALGRLAAWDETRGKADDDQVAGVTMSVLLDTEQEAEHFIRALAPTLTDVTGDAGSMALADLGLDADFTRARVEQFVRSRLGASSKLVVARTLEQLEALVRDAIAGNRTVGELRQSIRGKYAEIEAGRAVTIARTETGSAVNFGTLDGWKQSGLVKRKEWIDSGDAVVRDSHAGVEPVPLDEPFSVNGAALMHPLDPAGPPEEVINCRCAMAPVIDG